MSQKMLSDKNEQMKKMRKNTMVLPGTLSYVHSTRTEGPQ